MDFQDIGALLRGPGVGDWRSEINSQMAAGQMPEPRTKHPFFQVSPRAAGILPVLTCREGPNLISNLDTFDRQDTFWHLVRAIQPHG